MQVPNNQGRSEKDGVERGATEERSKGKPGGERVAFAGRGGEDDHSEKGCGKGSKDESEQGERRSKPCADHGQQLDVSGAETLTASDEIVGPADQQKDERCEQSPHNRVQGRENMGNRRERRQQTGIENAEDETGNSEGVRQAQGFSVHDRETEEQEAEDCHANAERVESEAEIAEQEKSGRGELDRRIAPRDGAMTGAAASAEDDPAQQRDIVAAENGCAAVRAARARPDNRCMPRQAADAYVEEAAEGKTEKDGEDGGQQDRGFSPQDGASQVRGSSVVK